MKAKIAILLAALTVGSAISAWSQSAVVVQPTQQLTYDIQPFPFGPQLDVLPVVTADGYTIQMTLIPTITEFLGYDDQGPFVPQGSLMNRTASAPLPHFRLRQVPTS